MASIKDFEITKTLGSGSFSSVYKARRISDGQEYALKMVKLPSLSAKEKENALNEVRILASIDNINIVGYKQAFYDDASQSLCIVMELASGGDLMNKVNEHKKNGTFIPEDEIWNYIIQMAQGLKTLHDMKILHRDLKCANIFLGSDGKTIKLGDLNVSKIAQHGLVYTQAGTPYYTSPEIWQDKPYGNKSDMWSLGCVIYELCSLNPPFRASSMTGLYQKVLKGVYDRIPAIYSSELSRLVGMCLNLSPNSRPCCDKLLSLPIVAIKMEELGIQKVKGSPIFNGLLNTIRMPRNIKNLSEVLPKPNYKLREVASLVDLDEKIEKVEVEKRFDLRRRALSRNARDSRLLKRNITPSFNDLHSSKNSRENSMERNSISRDHGKPILERYRNKTPTPSVPPLDLRKKPERTSSVQRSGRAVLLDIFKQRADEKPQQQAYLQMDNSVLDSVRLPALGKPSSRGGQRSIFEPKEASKELSKEPREHKEPREPKEPASKLIKGYGRSNTPVMRPRKISDDIVVNAHANDRLVRKEQQSIFYGDGPRARIARLIY